MVEEIYLAVVKIIELWCICMYRSAFFFYFFSLFGFPTAAMVVHMYFMLVFCVVLVQTDKARDKMVLL